MDVFDSFSRQKLLFCIFWGVLFLKVFGPFYPFLKVERSLLHTTANYTHHLFWSILQSSTNKNVRNKNVTQHHGILLFWVCLASFSILCSSPSYDIF